MGGRESSKEAVLVVQVGGNEVLTWLLAEGIESKEQKWNDLANDLLMT